MAGSENDLPAIGGEVGTCGSPPAGAYPFGRAAGKRLRIDLIKWVVFGDRLVDDRLHVGREVPFARPDKIGRQWAGVGQEFPFGRGEHLAGPALGKASQQ
jgi:hypothetical protein